MKKTIRLTESDLTRIVKRVVTESENDTYYDFLNRIEDGGELDNAYSQVWSAAVKLIRVSDKLYDEISSNDSLDDSEKDELLSSLEYYTDRSEELKDLFGIEDYMIHDDEN